ncbi:MAG: ANTAR domain-containing protein [Actinomycetes bacterium]
MTTVKVAEAVQAVAGFLVADLPLGATLDRVARLAHDGIPHVAAVGITLLDHSQRPSTSVCTGEVALAVDQAQYDENAGPCLEAYQRREVVRVDDTRTAGRWPSFSRRAVEVGIGSVLSLPLTAGDLAYGAFNLYATDVHAFRPDDHSDPQLDAQLFATQASVLLANAAAYWAAFDLAAGLKEAMKSRATIEQAKGVIMATRRCSAEEAFQLLVSASQRNNVKLRDVAARVVAGRGGRSGRPPPVPSVSKPA